MTPLTREDIERILDWPNRLTGPSVALMEQTIRDLATTALSVMAERDEWADKTTYQYKRADEFLVARNTAEARVKELTDLILAHQKLERTLMERADTAEARIAALEEGLRDAIVEAHGYGLLRDHPEGTSAGVECPAVICRDTRALLSERDSPNIEVIATHVDNPEKGGSTERDMEKGGGRVSDELRDGTGECDRNGWQHAWCLCGTGSADDPYHCANCGRETHDPRAAAERSENVKGGRE